MKGLLIAYLIFIIAMSGSCSWTLYKRLQLGGAVLGFILVAVGFFLIAAQF